MPPAVTGAGVLAPAADGLVCVFATVMCAGVLTCVVALPQLVAGVQLAPGVGGVVPPVGSVEA